MAEDAIRGVLTKLGEVAVSETKIQIKVGSDIILLRDRLEWLQAVVRDADRKRRAGTVDVLTRVWVRQTRDVAFEAEDALDQFFYEQVVCPRDRWYFRYWNASIGLCTKAVVRRGSSCQIKIIKSRLDQISENQKEYKIVHTPSVTSASSTTAIAAWRDDLENAVGFDKDIEILMKMLLPLNKIKKKQPLGHEHSPDDPMPLSIVGTIVEESSAEANNLVPVSIVGETSGAEVGKDLVPISRAGEMGDVSGAEVHKQLVPMGTVGGTVEASGAEMNKHPVPISKDTETVEVNGAEENKHPVLISKDAKTVEASGAEVNKHPVPISKDTETVEVNGAEENKHPVPITKDAETVEASGAEENKHPVPISKDTETVEVNGAEENKHPVLISKDAKTVEASGAEENKHPVPISKYGEIVEASGHGVEKKKHPISISKDEEIIEVSGAKKDTHPMFISIVGESGAGKNTLARIICRMMTPNKKMTSDKKIVVWYNMELGSSTENVLSELYRRASLKLTAEEQLQEPGTSSEDIGENLRGILTGKRYLLILGGISSKTILNSVRASLPDPDQDNDNGSRVLLILDTENEEVAWHANTMNGDGFNAVHLLTHLDQPRTAELFFWKVLRKGQYGKEVSTNRSLEERKNEKQMKQEEEEKLVHEITGGYPMAIVLLAGLLRFKEKPVQWDAVLQQLKSGKNGTQDGGEGLPNGQVCGPRRTMEMVFWASFEDLPDDLKSCFLYFASYPANFSHSADELVQMWIGEGFIKPHEGRTMEDVGHNYLKELVLRCLVEVEEMKADGGIQLVRVHKSLMGFLRSEVREAGFMEIHDIHDATVPPSARRLSVRSDNSRRYTTNFASKKFHKLRSFICRIIIDDDHHQHDHDLEFLRWSRFLRIISVQGLKLGMLPDKIGDMINLRYLHVDCPDLQSLPSSITKLLNLQTLNITNTQVKEIHQDFWKIKTLRHVLATDLMLSTTMEVVEEDQSCGGSELQTLHGVRLYNSGRWGAGNGLWNNMTNLRSLEMHGEVEFEAVIGNMPLLGYLKLQGDEIPACVFTDPSLRSLRTMVLDGNVIWDNITADVLRKARPNLVQLVLNDTIEVPQEIKEQLGTILVLQPTEEERRI